MRGAGLLLVAAAIGWCAAPPLGVAAPRETVIHRFHGATYTGPGGSNPQAGLIEDSSGDLYGTTEYGGNNGIGEVFELIPPALGRSGWTKRTLVVLGVRNGGEYPTTALTPGPQGRLYGTSESGGNGEGNVFEVLPPAGGATEWTGVQVFAFPSVGGEDGF